jgi:hypothetical protein
MSKLTLVLWWSFAALAAYAAGPLQPAWTSVSDSLIAVVPGVTQLLIDSKGSTASLASDLLSIGVRGCNDGELCFNAGHRVK